MCLRQRSGITALAGAEVRKTATQRACKTAPPSKSRRARKSLIFLGQSNPLRDWWTSLEENGHWVLIVSKEELQIGFDPWGFPLGELKQEVLSQVPNSPEVAKAASIATQLWRSSGRPSPEFIKAIQRCLRELKESGLALAAPLGSGRQLGWYLPDSAHTAHVNVTDAPIKPEPIAEPKSTVTASSDGAAHQSLQRSIGLQRKVLTLLPEAPEFVTAAALVAFVEKDFRMSSDRSLKLIQTQLRELQLKQLIRAVRVDGGARLGWCRR